MYGVARKQVIKYASQIIIPAKATVRISEPHTHMPRASYIPLQSSAEFTQGVRGVGAELISKIECGWYKLDESYGIEKNNIDNSIFHTLLYLSSSYLIPQQEPQLL